MQVQPQPEAQPPRLQPARLMHWEFGSGSNQTGVLVQQDSLVFHATVYATYATFAQQWLDVMRSVGEQIPNLFAYRIGLRYLNFILPNAGETPEDYVADRLRCDPAPGLPYRNHRGLTAAEYHLEWGLLAVRYSRGTGQPSLPPDLAPLALEPSVILQRIVSTEQPTAVLDIDRFVALGAAYDADTLAEPFGQLHADIQVAFNALATDHARAVWCREPLA